ncbi:MAG: type I-E CRISPR-associated protein Cse2/CasB [Proteobacteria bacterium]|nr:type I-E CRISPR-associated protein Cse2/CasB [Pseudomonadota bacterium]
MTEQKNKDRFEDFVKHLESLRDREDRGALAGLRRGLVRGPAQDPGVFRHVFPFVAGAPWEEDACLLVAALFALHPDSGGEGNMGKVFRRIQKADAARSGSETEGNSTEKRFMALLNARFEDLPVLLRHAVSLARAREVPVDWRQLLKDLRYWGHEDRFVQRAWAKGYWGGGKENGKEKKDEAAVA